MPKETFRIYPDGCGRFALGSPDGRVLQQHESIAVVLREQAIVGVIEHSRNGDYLRTEAGATLCGLYAGMVVCVAETTEVAA